MSAGEQFKREITELLKRYDARYVCVDHYDQDEQPEGSTDCIQVGGELFTLADFDIPSE